MFKPKETAGKKFTVRPELQKIFAARAKKMVKFPSTKEKGNNKI